MPDKDLEHELRTAIGARRDLGEAFEPELVEGFVERIEERLAQRHGADVYSLQAAREHQKEMVLGSMGISVPLMVFAALWAGLPGVIAICVTLCVIAIATRPKS